MLHMVAVSEDFALSLVLAQGSTVDSCTTSCVNNNCPQHQKPLFSVTHAMVLGVLLQHPAADMIPAHFPDQVG